MKKIIDNFQLIFDSREKIQELRNLILNLAVRGKLVPQNSDDEPSSVLIEKIKKEKERLIKEKKIRKKKPLPPIKEEEIPFELPESWEWVRLGNIGRIVGGGTPKTKVHAYWENGNIAWLTPADLNGLKSKYISRGRRNITKLGLQNSSAKLLPKGSVLFSSRAPIGYVAIAQNDLATNQGFKSCVPYIMDMNQYIYYFLMYDAKRINDNASGTTFKEVSGKEVANFIFPLPPLNEQKRIVNKLDELMTFCDQLEVSLEKKANAKQLVSKSISNRIQKSKSKEELDKNITFIIRNLKEVYTTPENLNDLKDIILQLAIQGKLVPQDPDDEPASVLIEKINKEKERLIKEKKIRKTKPLPPIKEAEIPFELPKGWEWVRLGEIMIINQRNKLNDNLEVSFVPMKLIEDGYLSKHSHKKKLWKEVKKGYTHFKENDLVVAKITPCFENRKSAIMKNLYSGYGAGTTELHVLTSYLKEIDMKFFLYIVKAKNFINQGVSTFTGTAGQQRIRKDFIENFVIGLPPLNEQKQIVKKIDKLMALCNLLENQINKNRNNSELLMKSLQRKLFE
ncbi:restriction endonuclease subunit S [Halothermothrix orenii]|uniref:Restriction modification system DNA specificity domain protein n=1 Tax=Halothermothrix orenii (strain H 168 / OCM 544 / DSM 9562) TaxID=373903 RepID=B8CZR4_HALOH|nr:restriction endonuclease subunit S [Halothermothrix orenii]ACL70766.1 restriction modification system DNA specificity domain protein [Halothermothrix orenii H 168]